MNNFNTNYLNNLYCNDDETSINRGQRNVIPHYEASSTSIPYHNINQVFLFK